MNIEKNKVVAMHYILKDADGVVMDSSEGKEPLTYLHGNQNLIPGMEEALVGKKAGDKLKIVLPPEKAYGLRRDDLVNKVPLANFPEKDQVKVGVQFQTQTEEGVRIATVIDVKGNEVTIDFNHPLAGEKLSFDVEVVSVREATKEELSHGHVHGPSCQH